MLKYFILSFIFFIGCSKASIVDGKHLYIKDNICYHKEQIFPSPGVFFQYNDGRREVGHMVDGLLNKDWKMT